MSSAAAAVAAAAAAGAGAAPGDGDGNDDDTQETSDGRLAVLSEEIAYDRYLQVWDRSIRLSDGSVAQFDVVGHKRSNRTFCIVVPYHSETKEVTLIREWAQGPNSFLLSFPTGGFDPRKHTSLLACAQMELAEEARLMRGEWVDLMPEEGRKAGLAEGKWITNRFFCFLAIDPVPDPCPPPRDREELIFPLRLPLAQVYDMASSGVEDIHPCSLRALMMANRELAKRGLTERRQ